MNRKRILIATLLVATPAMASPLVLESAGGRGASFAVQSSGESAVNPLLLWSLGIQGTVYTPPQTTREVQLVLDLQSATDPRQGPFTLVSPFVGDGAHASVEFHPGSPDDFNGFAGLITNGVADDLRLLWRWRDDGCPFPCSGQGGLIGEFDLAGNTLDSVRLLIQKIQIDPLNEKDSGGFTFTFDVAYDFLGAPVPEPQTLTLLSIAVGAWKLGMAKGPAVGTVAFRK